MPLNPKDAPAGFTAEPPRGEHGWLCLGCHFIENPLPCPDEPCCPCHRSDKSHVIFVKARKKGKKAKPKKKARARKAST